MAFVEAQTWFRCVQGRGGTTGDEKKLRELN